MNPFAKTIKFSEKKQNHFYCIKKDNEYIKIDNPKVGDKVYEVPTISGGALKKLILQIPIPLCDKHQHDGVPFGVKTCRGWEYIAIPIPLGSLMCRECLDMLHIPMPFLSNSDLSNSDLRGSNLSNSDLRGSNLSNSDLSNSDLRGSNLRGSNLPDAINVDQAYWSKFTQVNDEFKKLLNKDRFF